MKENEDIRFVDGSKGRNDAFHVSFYLERSKTSRVALVALRHLLKEANKKYEARELNVKLDLLYGAGIGFNVSICKNHYVFIAFVRNVNKKYLQTKVNIEKRAISLLYKVIDSGWSGKEEDLNIVKETLEFAYHNSLKSPNSLTRIRMEENFIDEEDNIIFPGGTPEEIASLTCSDIDEVWNQVRHAPRSIAILSTDKDKSLKYGKKFTTNLGKIISEPRNIKYKEAQDLVESSENTQSVLMMYYKSIAPKSVRQFVTGHVSMNMLGGSASSVLFRKVREEKGYCYDISSSLISSRDMISISTGITKGDYKTCLKYIKEIVSDVVKYVDEELFKTTVKTIRFYYRSVLNDPLSLFTYQIQQGLSGRSPSPQVAIDELDKMTLDDIKEYLSKLEFIGSYAVLGNKGE